MGVALIGITTLTVVDDQDETASDTLEPPPTGVKVAVPVLNPSELPTTVTVAPGDTDIGERDEIAGADGELERSSNEVR